MNNKSLVELKMRACEFIQEYEKQQTERQYQKQRLKQNIMLEILSNRNKSQGSQSQAQNRENSRLQQFTREQINNRASQVSQGHSYIPNSQQREIQKFNVAKDKASKSEIVGAFQDQDNNNGLAEITFKAGHKGKNSYILVQGQSEFSENANSFHQSSNRSLKNKQDDEFDTVRNVKKQQQMTFRGNKSKKENISQLEQKVTQRMQKFKFNQPQIQPESQNSQIQEQERQFSSAYSQSHKQFISGREQQKEQEIQEQFESTQNKHGVFLTVDEDQSMEETHQIHQKNYAFDIVMDKSEPIDNLDDLRKRKIEQLEKKRQMRINEQKQIKKPDIPVHKQIRNSGYSQKKSQNKSYTKISEDPDPEPTYSVLRQKAKESEKKTNLTNNNSNSVQQSFYGIKNTSGIPVKRGSYLVGQQHESHEQLKTPKSIVSETRNSKSRGKNTIFKESPRRNEKSIGKFSQDPKIEPKERKNTFIKQSNRKLMVNAITNTCLPGQINRKQREKLIGAIDSETSEFFVFLFKDFSRKVIKAIYVLDYSQSSLHKIYGDKAPEEIISENVKTFYRFDSGSRQFKKLDGCKSFSLVVHAIDLR